MKSDDKVTVPAVFDQDQFDFLDDIAKGLRISVSAVVENAVIASVLSAAYPKDEARLQYVTMQARVDRWRREVGQ
jgi:hypothetical protein